MCNQATKDGPDYTLKNNPYLSYEGENFNFVVDFCKSLGTEETLNLDISGCETDTTKIYEYL
jgi:hypothetical protein